MRRHVQKPAIVLAGILGFLLWGCSSLRPAAPEALTNHDLIETLRHERIETLYYAELPRNVKELVVRSDIAPELIDAFDRGGDDLYRFNVILVLNHLAALSGSDKAAVVECLWRATQDSSNWVRTEAVWGIGFLDAMESIPKVIPLLDDPDPGVVNETVLTLAKLAGAEDAPVSNEEMSEEERKEAVALWKAWWEGARSKWPK